MKPRSIGATDFAGDAFMAESTVECRQQNPPVRGCGRSLSPSTPSSRWPPPEEAPRTNRSETSPCSGTRPPRGGSGRCSCPLARTFSPQIEQGRTGRGTGGGSQLRCLTSSSRRDLRNDRELTLGDGLSFHGCTRSVFWPKCVLPQFCHTWID